MIFRNSKNYNYLYFSKKGFTLLELVIITALIGFLASISIPSSLRWIYKVNQKSYTNELASFFGLLRRESRRWGGTCSIKLNYLAPGNEGKGFFLNCVGLNNASKNNLNTSIPIIKKTVFQEVNSEFDITPKGQISINNSNDSFVVVIGGRYDQSNSQERPKCLVIQSPAGTIRTGVYSNYYKYYSNKVGSRFNYNLRENLCISY